MAYSVKYLDNVTIKYGKRNRIGIMSNDLGAIMALTKEALF